jgi:CheY-like chemotaxis protein
VSKASTRPAKSRRRILVVDDDPDVADVVVEILKGNGYDAWAESSPLAVLKRAAELHLDLLIVEFDMPKMLGTELTVLLKNTPATSTLPIIFLSGMTDEELRNGRSLPGDQAANNMGFSVRTLCIRCTVTERSQERRRRSSHSHSGMDLFGKRRRRSLKGTTIGRRETAAQEEERPRHVSASKGKAELLRFRPILSTACKLRLGVAIIGPSKWSSRNWRESTMAQATPSNTRPFSGRIPVLIVDDNPANRMAFESVLTPLGLNVVLASSGKEALERIGETEFAIILLDVRMPILDGYQTAELMRQHKSTRYTPIIFTSAYDMTPAQVTRAYVAGAIDYVPSPVDGDVLKLKVAAYIQLYLRDEAVLQAIRELTVSYEALKADLAATHGMNSGLQSKVAALEHTIRRLTEELDRCTCGCTPNTSLSSTT